ncbi:hypothetical protein L210DRAFT_2696897 [Boletus edulis BED1]|uniref:Uncharacterized protein n=1 Tax=Boletus edulis BED1 TaxID=1328754 RepID=A0AAD4BL61_BOLED|nr:hypothetical protein L210DRAFT_2696897 [Boletus edulis BED1]
MNVDTLELVEDDFTEQEHKEMDVKLDWLSVQLTQATLTSIGPLLLLYIIDQLGDRAVTKHPSTEWFRWLIETRPNLGNTLLEALRNGSYSSVRRLSKYSSVFTPCICASRVIEILRKNEDEPPWRRFGPNRTGAAVLAWTCEYRGNYHQIMLNNINAMDRSTPLANSVALIQSSGTGKSRMVDEMAKLVFTIPFNVRLPDERSSRAYPPEDSAVWEYLCKSDVKKAEDGEVRAALFFQNLFSEVATEVEHVFSGRRIASPGELASEWWNHLTKLSGAFRDELYKRVVQECKKGPSQGSPRCSDDVRPTLDRLLAALYKFCDLRAVEDDVKVAL